MAVDDKILSEQDLGLSGMGGLGSLKTDEGIPFKTAQTVKPLEEGGGYFYGTAATPSQRFIFRKIMTDAEGNPQKLFENFESLDDIEKQFIASMSYEVYTRDAGTIKGSYVATLDNYHGDIDTIDYGTSETPEEHKSHNIIELENGQFCLYPNNRTRIYDNSLTPAEPLTPDFKVSTRYYEVENENKLERFGDSEEYFYKSKKEK